MIIFVRGAFDDHEIGGNLILRRFLPAKILCGVKVQDQTGLHDNMERFVLPTGISFDLSNLLISECPASRLSRSTVIEPSRGYVVSFT